MPDGIFANSLHIFSLMKDKGNLLRKPYVKSLSDGLFEAIAKSEEGIARAFLKVKSKVIIIFHAFIKKNQ